MTFNKQTQPPISWSAIVAAQQRLIDAPTNENAQQFRKIVDAVRHTPPNHIRPILKQIRRIQDMTGKAASQIRVLDHGCGGCMTLMYLAALGYTNVHGVDIGGALEKTDRALRILLGLNERRIWLYDGCTLPFTDAMFDLIYSQQVLEHVKDRFIGSYLAEEVRALNGDGIVYHQIPHRWNPWESHTKTWLIHYFPRFLRRPIYKYLGHDPDYLEDMLHLRSPFFFYSKFRQAFSNCRNETLERIAMRPDPSYYDGNIRLRSLVGRIAEWPIVRNIIIHFVMIDLTASPAALPR